MNKSNNDGYRESTLKEQFRAIVYGIPVVGSLSQKALATWRDIWNPFPGSVDYWDRRYARGGTSGAGSYGRLADWKAEVVNDFVRRRQVQSVIEFGCGDGNQLSLAKYPKYIGLDVSKTAIALCKERFQNDATKNFFLYDSLSFVDRHGIFRADLAMSLDVIYHLVEDAIYDVYMSHLFAAAERYVLIYSSDHASDASASHVRHRKFTTWIDERRPNWSLMQKIENPFAGGSRRAGAACAVHFFLYQKL